MSEDARLDEEHATQRRARVVNLAYIDTSQMPDKPLYKDLLSVDEMKQFKIVPVQFVGANLVFGVTNITSQSTMERLVQRFADQVVSFAIISDTGFKAVSYTHLDVYKRQV